MYSNRSVSPLWLIQATALNVYPAIAMELRITIEHAGRVVFLHSELILDHSTGTTRKRKCIHAGASLSLSTPSYQRAGGNCASSQVLPVQNGAFCLVPKPTAEQFPLQALQWC